MMKSTFRHFFAACSAVTLIFVLTACSEQKAETNTEAVASAPDIEVAGENLSPILTSISTSIVNAQAESVAAAKVAEAPYVAFYYSAHWCPPCRLFTPKLVEFYHANGGGERFEIVFVSSDRSEADMFGYMKEAKMPWLAVNYDSIASSNIKQYAGPYIPWLIVFDREGNQVAATDYDKGIDPAAVLEQLGDMI